MQQLARQYKINNDIRNRVLSNLSEERVEVNHRPLIDKILARYSSEFVIYRELIQNSDDAKSSSIQIIFETEGNSLWSKIIRITFKNNGFAFRPEDWDRLKKIAEGNPDEQKIGAFGVGFYSLFSVCEEPFVSSGGQGMAFFWRHGQLTSKQGPTGDDDKVWTTFLMDMREPIELPNVESFAQFLANSLGFTGNLREISVYFNNILAIHLSKNIMEPKSINISSELDTYSPRKMFQLTSVLVKDVQLEVRRVLIPTNMSANQWYPTDLQTEQASILLRITSGNLDVNVSDTFSAEMERITKKKPPRKTTIQMIFTGFNEHENYNGTISSVFKNLLPYPEQGRIYIGFSTHQTTGCCSHLAARVIPTVERESIDLAEKTLSIYNHEMLCLAGTLCRILYDDEMAYIEQLYNEMISENNSDSFREWIGIWAAYNLTYCTFRNSTPNEKVGKILEEQFFNCSKKNLPILSTNGVLPISNIRLPNSEMEGFIKIVPIVPKVLFEQCIGFFTKAKNTYQIIGELTLNDVLYELRNRTLSEDEMAKLLNWWISYRSSGNNVDSSEFNQFMQFARIDKKSQSLSTIRYFLNPVTISSDVDIPDDVLPYAISKDIDLQDLVKWFGWSELPLVNWATFIVNKPDIEVNPVFAEKVHYILARSLDNISQDDKETIRQLFVQKQCIPTRFGMMYPSKAYFENVNLFPNLPTIQFQESSMVQNIMDLLGVRKVVELQLIFQRLLGQGDWDHMQLVKYLSLKFSDLNEDEITILKSVAIWPKKNLQQSKKAAKQAQIVQRFVANNLHVPSPIHRDLGLPIIDWQGRWDCNAQEEKFLIELGIREYPTLQKILELAAPPTDPEIRKKALKYFITNFDEKYFSNYNWAEVKVAFLPCSVQGIYAKPSECFINPKCSIMGFQVVRQDLKYQVEKLGVLQNPDPEQLLEKLKKNRPQDENKGKEIFEYLASQQGDFITSDWNTLNYLEFIPFRVYPDIIIHASPFKCFFKIQEDFLNGFFLRVDFGEKANKFLQSCGVKNEPTPVDFAELLVNSSRELMNSNGGDVEKYISILRRIAMDYKLCGSITRKLSLVEKMKSVPILLAVRRLENVNNVNPGNQEIQGYQLATANEIYINDDIVYQGIFNTLTAPEEDYLEPLYKWLGCRSLHDSVKEVAVPKGFAQQTKNSQQLQDTILERASLFYFKHPTFDIKKDEEWLKRLKVREVNYIETTYSLGNKRQTSKDSCNCILQDVGMNSWTLYITSNLKLLDISKHIAKNIFKTREWNSTFRIHTLLTTSLSSLKDQNSINSCNLISGNIDCIDTQEYFENVQNQISYCDIVPAQSLLHVGFSQDISLYVPKDADRSEIMSPTRMVPLTRFINMLKDLATIFGIIPNRVISVFYDDNSTSIAFNYNRSLFFNLKFYIGYHDKECAIRPTINAMTYWFMTFCHELAHNYVKHHNADHEYYFSSFAEAYMAKFFEMMKNYEAPSELFHKSKRMKY
ncbi:hypothetical protein GLOIN_2v1492674 [Rhizophagus clarus]|uniref:Sacsin/Nov domain-containing protein n=1 Tax=Rhizophagus clarus TaxID=94130 RepID=A0A8H3KY80_9GLOM|nr:hypothetical protein GLOIN_2v1492674 [Rhizophagus clarus]